MLELMEKDLTIFTVGDFLLGAGAAAAEAERRTTV